MYQKKYRKMAQELVEQMTIEEQMSQLRFDSPEIPRLNIPAYNWWNEALHGVARAGTATSFPQAIGLAAMFDDELLQKIGDVIATEGRAKYNESIKHGDRDIYKGLTFWSPNINMFRDPRWGRGHETYGEDPFLTSCLGCAYIKGMQGNGKHLKTAACAKHFAVHSGPEDLRHQFDAKASLKEMWEYYLPAFEFCVTEGKVESVMGAYNRTNGEPSCASKELLGNILRGQWNFQGHVVSDCLALRDFHTGHKVTANEEESAAMALKAGCDLNCGVVYRSLPEAYKKNMVTAEEIKEAAIHVLTTRFKLGMFEDTVYDKIKYEVVECKKHQSLAEKAVEKSCVLLKNDGILPLKRRKGKTIGVIGPNANSRLALKGNYYGTSSCYTTVLEGIQQECKSIRVLYAKGCELEKDRTEALAMEHDRLAEAITVAEHSDYVVLCLGLDETLEGEESDEGNNYGSGDKKDLELPKVQQELLEAVVKTKTPVILCLLAGSAINLSYAQEHCAAIILGWYPGARGGKGIARILFGDVSPSGKLPITFYQSVEDLPAFTDYSLTNRTYRYYQGRPLYPFGFGLTYGEVHCVEAFIANETKDGWTLSVTAENVGMFDTEDVIQVYGKVNNEKNVPLHPVLCGFKRIFLGKGRISQFSVEVKKRALYPVDENGNRKKAFLSCDFYVGTMQPDERSKELYPVTPIKIQWENREES